MDVTNNSTIDSVIDFANAKFGMELTKDQISSQLRELSFAETLRIPFASKSNITSHIVAPYDTLYLFIISSSLRNRSLLLLK